MDRPFQRADGWREGRTVRSMGRTVCASSTESCPLDQEPAPKAGRSVPQGRRPAQIPLGSARGWKGPCLSGGGWKPGAISVGLRAAEPLELQDVQGTDQPSEHGFTGILFGHALQSIPSGIQESKVPCSPLALYDRSRGPTHPRSRPSFYRLRCLDPGPAEVLSSWPHRLPRRTL
jgi:hypothetical protein